MVVWCARAQRYGHGQSNRLTVDGRPFTPAGWNVRTVLAVTDEDVLAVVQRAPEIAPPRCRTLEPMRPPPSPYSVTTTPAVSTW